MRQGRVAPVADASSAQASALAVALRRSSRVRIVKKTLKGNLLGKTKVRSASSDRSRSRAEDGDVADLPTRLKPSAQASLDALVKDDEVVIVPATLKSSAGQPIPIGRPERETRQAAQRAAAERADAFALPGTPVVRTDALRSKDGTPHVLPSTPSPVPTNGTSSKTAPALHAPPPAPPPVPFAPEKTKLLRRKPKEAPAPAPATPAPAPLVATTALGRGGRAAPSLDGDDVAIARSTLANALLRAVGEPGSEVRQPKGTTFHIGARHGEGVVRTQHLVTIPLPSGHVVSHDADLVVEMDNKAILMVDVVASHTAPELVKARSFDALLLRRIDRSFSVLVCVRTPGPGIGAEQLEAIAHGYDLHFNIAAADVHLESKFAALRSRIAAWVESAAKT
jgi:hypothetical protein